MKTKLYFLLLITFCLVAARQAFIANDLVGTWKYNISDVPPEYETGLLVFEEKDSKMTGYVEASEKQEMTGLSVENGKVNFTTESGAGAFKYSFDHKGDTLSGVIESQYGNFAIKAVKQAGK